MQDLIDITLDRICKVGSLENKLVDGAEYVAQVKVGSDLITSDSNYDMKLTDENIDDTNIVATDLVLLQIADSKIGVVIH